jgi:hypothetical protein
MVRFNYFQVISIVGLLTFTLLGGCASIDDEDCQNTDWYKRGLAEGRWGASGSQIKAHAKVCGKVKVIPDEAAWRAGHAEGVKSYCTANSGWNRGSANEPYRGACVGLDESTFLRYHSAGQQLYRARQELRQVNEKRKKLEADYNFTTKEDVRRRLRDDIHRTDKEYARLTAVVAAYELAGPPR